MHTRAKICGITSIDDANHAINAGADALGFVFYKRSPRYIEPHIASQICKSLPPFVTRVGLFVNASRTEVNEIIKEVGLDLLQFHGDECESDCLGFEISYIKAVHIKGENDYLNAVNSFPSARAILVDTYKPGIPGGTGERFDWSLLPDNHPKPLILAGGLTTENIFQAICSVRPYAVDVSGGVESSKGIKNPVKVTQFLNEVSRASE